MAGGYLQSDRFMEVYKPSITTRYQLHMIEQFSVILQRVNFLCVIHMQYFKINMSRMHEVVCAWSIPVMNAIMIVD